MTHLACEYPGMFRTIWMVRIMKDTGITMRKKKVSKRNILTQYFIDWDWIDNEHSILWWVFDVYGPEVEDNSVILAYASFEDPDAYGKQLTFTCSTIYSKA